jgi:Protein of unknown function (DUF3761)
MGLIYRAMIVIAFLASISLASSPASAATRHYDCSKPGNANKAACRGGSAATAAAAKSTKTATTKTTTATTTRHYDCTKAGNANKAECRTAAKQSPAGRTPGAVKTTTKTTATTTDCTKWYNRLRATCRTTSSSSAPKTTVAPAAKRVAAKPSAAGNGEAVNNKAAGAIAQCKDGGYSHAAHRSGACSRHGGVAKWLAAQRRRQ